MGGITAWWVIWFGLATAAAELAVLGYQHLLRGRLIGIGAHVVWMAPLADLAVAIVLGGLVALVVRRQRRFAVVLALSVFLFLSIQLAYLTRLHPAAMLVVAAGAGWQCARWLLAHEARLRRGAKISAVLMGLAAAAAAVVLLMPPRLEAVTPRAASGDRPNVLFIVLDTVRAQNLGLYGYERATTPNIERLATTGLVFDQAWVAAPWTAPSHAAMFTGYYPHQLSVGLQVPLDGARATLAEYLRGRGYRTAGFVGNNLAASAEYGFSRGFETYVDQPVQFSEAMRSSSVIRWAGDWEWPRRLFGRYEVLGRHKAPRVLDTFRAWRGEGHEPFFAFVNLFDAHVPILPPAPWDTAFVPADRRGDPREPRFRRAATRAWRTPARLARELDAYDGAIGYLDSVLAQLYSQLRDEGLLDRTIVVLTSDHGEEFGEKGRVGHMSGLAATLLRVPLVVHLPGKNPGGRRIGVPITMADLPATLAELATPGVRHPFPGQSFAWTMDGSASTAPPARTGSPLLAQLQESQSLVLDGWHYIDYENGREELYHVDADPAEKFDLGRQTPALPEMARLRVALRDALADADRRAGGPSRPAAAGRLDGNQPR